MTKSEQINELAGALAKAQIDIKGALKDSTNPFFKSQYSDFASVWEAVKRPLTLHGLSVTQSPSLTLMGNFKTVTVTTLLMHSSGQWIESQLDMEPKDFSPQAVGSCISYARRYALSAITCCPSIDDDGEAAQGRHIANNPAVVMPESVQAPIQATRAPTKPFVSPDACKGHKWLKSKFRENEEYCLHCKLKRVADAQDQEGFPDSPFPPTDIPF